MDLHAILEAIASAEREGAKLILSASHIAAENKTSPRDVVTAYDRAVQALLEERLSAAVPGACFFCEESTEQGSLTAEHVFIIDPIDGTMNFVHGCHYSCISVAYASFGTVKAGAVYDPYADEMFTAVLGGGAFCNGKPICASSAPLSENLCSCGTAPYHSELTDLTFSVMRRMLSFSLDLRRSGSAALDLCNVAAGRTGLYFEAILSLWDYAAGALICAEAGGRVSDMKGAPLPLTGETSSVLAGGVKCYEDYFSSPSPEN